MTAAPWLGITSPHWCIYSDTPRGRSGRGALAWVTFEEDARKVMDRPVLVVGRDGDHLMPCS